MDIEELLDELEDRYHVEGGKFHLAGCSAGGLSAFYMAITYPDRFHSLTGLPGLPPREFGDRDLLNLEGVHVSHFVGGEDSDSWVEGAKTTHEKLRKLGVDSKLTVLPRDGHIPETLFGDRFMNHMDKVRRKISGDARHASRD